MVKINVNAVRNNFSSLITPVNISLRDGVCPDKLKIARVTPVFKKGNASEINIYCPISALSCASETLERNMYNRVFDYLIENDFYKKQVGF